MVAMTTDKMLTISARGVPQIKTLSKEAMPPIIRLLCKVKVVVAYNKRRKLLVFLVKLGMTVPKCKPVLRRPQKSPPIKPLILKMLG
jgi:hypothetical protein